jgi:hypothetical protein
LRLLEVIQWGDNDSAAIASSFDPRELPAVWRYCYLANAMAAIQAFEDVFDVGAIGGVLGRGKAGKSK